MGIKWGRSHKGFVYSKCCRFDISPEYRAGTTPITRVGRLGRPSFYELHDYQERGIVGYRSTQAEAKRLADAQAKKFPNRNEYL